MAQEISDDLGESQKVRLNVDVVELCHIINREGEVERYKHLRG